MGAEILFFTFVSLLRDEFLYCVQVNKNVLDGLYYYRFYSFSFFVFQCLPSWSWVGFSSSWIQFVCPGQVLKLVLVRVLKSLRSYDRVVLGPI